MTINPSRHVDLVGLIMLMIFHFGWAKPVPVNPNNFKNYKVGNVIVSLAGVTANIIISIICVIIKKHVNIPVICAGRMEDHAVSAKAVSEGLIDAVGVAR